MASFGKQLHQDQRIVERHWPLSWNTICRLRVREGEALKESRPRPREQQYLDVCVFKRKASVDVGVHISMTDK
jgi:hypothetical protein